MSTSTAESEVERSLAGVLARCSRVLRVWRVENDSRGTFVGVKRKDERSRIALVKKRDLRAPDTNVDAMMRSLGGTQPDAIGSSS